MRLVDRLQEYLHFQAISAYAFEHACALSNGYLSKQLKGKGAIGSDILERIKYQYPDLSLVWLVTGKGSMLLSPNALRQERVTDLNEEQHVYYTSKDDVINVLNRQIEKLETAINDKDKIIRLMERQLLNRGR